MESCTTYTVTGNNTAVVWVFKYDLNGLLLEFKLQEGTLDNKQVTWLFHKDRFPYSEKRIKGWSSIKNLNVQIGEPDLSFEAFYNAYGNKVQKIRTEKLWNKLSKKDKMAAIAGIRSYNNWLRRQNGIAKAQPDTYLRNRRWEDDFKSL